MKNIKDYINEFTHNNFGISTADDDYDCIKVYYHQSIIEIHVDIYHTSGNILYRQIEDSFNNLRNSIACKKFSQQILEAAWKQL